MSDLVGKKVLIHSYKHDGSIHRSWETGFVLEETKDYFIVVNNHTQVYESDGRKWYTKEPAVCYFMKNEWFNVICMLRKNGIYYYCNIASPTLYDGEALKYIDYDLDLKVFPDNTYKILDRHEYQIHKKRMKYNKRIDYLCNKQLQVLIQMVKQHRQPFDKNFVNDWYQVYLEMTGNKYGTNRSS